MADDNTTEYEGHPSMDSPKLPSVEEMKARLAELVEQHGEGSIPVVNYQAELAAHPDYKQDGEPAQVDPAPEDPPAEAAQE